MKLDETTKSADHSQLGPLDLYHVEAVFSWENLTFRPYLQVVADGSPLRVAMEFRESDRRVEVDRRTTRRSDIIAEAVGRVHDRIREELPKMDWPVLHDRMLYALCELEERGYAFVSAHQGEQS